MLPMESSAATAADDDGGVGVGDDSRRPLPWRSKTSSGANNHLRLPRDHFLLLS